MSRSPNLSRRHEEIVALAGHGTAAAAVAHILGVCPSAVRKYCKRHGVRLANTKDRLRFCEDEFVAAVADTPRASELAGKFGVTTHTVRRWAKQLGAVLEDTYHRGYAVTHNGYKCVKAPGHPNADSKGYVREHVLVMEAHIGRCLEPHECVHHKDRDKQNNALENLELLAKAEHAALHAKEGETGWAVYHQRNKI